MTKQMQLLWNAQDEMLFNRLLIEALPSITFIDDQLSPTYPDCRSSIAECKSHLIYLCNSDPEKLPTYKRSNGLIEGPANGPVIQLIRCLRDDHVIRSGSIGAGFNKDNKEIKSFVSTTWKCLSEVGSVGVMNLSGKIDRHYMLGHHAKQEVLDGKIALRDRSVEVYFEPVPGSLLQ